MNESSDIVMMGTHNFTFLVIYQNIDTHKKKHERPKELFFFLSTSRVKVCAILSGTFIGKYAQIGWNCMFL